MSKIKVLVLPSDRTGVGKFRSVDPHIFLQNLYPNDFHVDIVYDPPMEDMNFWKDYPIVHFHRTIGMDYDKSKDFIEKLNAMGVVTIMDLDDYWLPTKEHPAYHLVTQNKLHEKTNNETKINSLCHRTLSLEVAKKSFNHGRSRLKCLSPNQRRRA